MTKRIGITGGIGAGKSLVCKILSIQGTPIYDADTRAKLIMHQPDVAKRVVQLLGEEAYQDGKVNRKYIASKVFSYKTLLEQLNGIVHPAVAEDFENWCRAHAEAPYVIKEAALLFETGSYKTLDACILVTAPEDVRIGRVLKRDTHRNRADVVNIIAKQMPETDKEKLAQYIIQNDGRHSVLAATLQLHNTLSAME